MIFLTTLLIKVLLATCVSLLLIRLLHPIIENTTKKIFNGDLQISLVKYIQIALFVLGVSSGTNLYSMRDFILKSNKSLSIERIIAEGFDSLKDSALSIIGASLFLLIIYLVITYINQLTKLEKDKQEPIINEKKHITVKESAINKEKNNDIN